jgi:ribose 5-phosphate isomerase RpiB
MNRNGQTLESTDGRTLHWPGRVLAAEDLRRGLNGHRRLLLGTTTIVTPLAAEQLKTDGIEIVREAQEARPAAAAPWGYAQDRVYPLVSAALRALTRDGLIVRELTSSCDGPQCQWARALAECVGRGECRGGAVFCADPGLVCCVINKVAGLRAAAVVAVAQAARATLTLGANVLAVEMPGRTYYEIRQILRTLLVGETTCPPGVACTLGELDGHAHR